MASAIDELLDRLAAAPADDDLLARVTSACLEARAGGGLVAGVRRLVEVLPADRLPDAARALAGGLEAAAERSEARDAMEIRLRAADLRLLADPGRGAEATARSLAEAWRSCPDARVVERAWAAIDGPDVEDTPDALLIAREQVADAETRRLVLGILVDRWTTQGRTEETAPLLSELALLAPEDPEVARRVAALAPTTARSRRRSRVVAETIAGSRADPALLAERWQKALTQASPKRAVLLRRKLFRLYRDALGRPDRARVVLIPGDEATPPAALDALAAARRHVAAGEHERAVDVLRDAALETDRREVELALLLQAARLTEVELADDAAAERIYRRIRILDPRSLHALAFYRDWYTEQDEPRRAYATMAQLYAALDGPDLSPERILVARDMAALAERALESPDKAIEAWRRVLAEDPVDSDANEGLRRLYAETRRWHALADHLDAWVRALPEEAVDDRVDLLFQLIELYQDADRLPMEDMVVATYQRIVAIQPSEVRALDSLAERYEGRQRWRDLVDVLARKVEVTEDPQELLELFMRIASLYLEQIRSDTEAIPVLERILELDPGNIAVVQRLRRVYRRRHDIEHLYGTYQRELALLEGPERLDVLVELATLASDELLRHDEAVRWWRQVLELDPGHERALAALQDLTAGEEDWPAHAALLEQRAAAAATRKKKVEILQDLGEVVYTRLGDEERALAIFKEIVEVSPFNSKARGFLQRIYVGRRAFDELGALFAPREDWKGYVALLRDVARKSGDQDLVADLHLEMARVEEKRLGEPERARASLLAALAAAPERVEVAQRLLAEHGEGLDAADLPRVLEAVAEHAEAPADRERAALRLAALRKLAGDAEGWLAAASQALLLQADDGRVDAAKDVDAAANASRQWERAAGVLAEAVARLAEGAREPRATLLRMMGGLRRTRLGDPEGAVAHYRRVLQLAPGDREALDALEEIHLSRNDFEGLEEVLRSRADHARDPAEAHQALRRLGQLHEDVFADLERAAATYLEVLEQAPDDAEARAALQRVLTADEAWAELASALEDLLPRLADPGTRAELHLTLARINRDHLGEPAVAVDHLRDLLDHPEGDHAAGVALLEAIFEDGEALATAAPVLEAVYRAREDAEPLARVLEVRLETSVIKDERLRVADELARLYEEALARPEDAFRARLARFRLDPDDRETWDELERLAGAASTWGELADAWREAVDPAAERAPRPSRPAGQHALRARLAAICRDRLDAPDEALALYETVMAGAEVLADYPDVLAGAEALHEARGDLAGLARVRLLAADGLLDAAARRQKILDACALLAGPLERLEEALEHYERLAREAPDDDEVAELLEGAYEKAARWEALSAFLELRAEALPGDRRADKARLRRALVRVEHLGEAPAGIGDLLGLVDSPAVGGEARDVLLGLLGDPETPEAERARIDGALAGFFEASGDAWGLAALLEVRATHAADGAAAAALLGEAAALLVPPEAAGEAAADEAAARRAMELYGAALEARPGDAATADVLERLASGLGAWPAYLRLLEAAADAAGEGPEQDALLQRLAIVAEREPGTTPLAVRSWERILGEGRAREGAHRGEALDALDRLYRELGDDAARVPILDLQAARAADDLARARILGEEARLLHALGRDDDAMAVLRRILDVTAGSSRADLLAERATATGRLEQHLREAGRDEDVIALLVEAADGADEPTLAVQWLRRAAHLARTEVEDRDLAIAILENAHARAHADAAVIESLDQLYQEAKRWDAKAALLAERLGLVRAAGDQEAALVVGFTLGQLQEHRLGDPGAAVATYAGLLDDAPTFAPALAALEALAREGNAAGPARRALLDARRAAGDWAAFATVAEAVLEAGDGSAAPGPLRAELARVLLEELGDAAGAWRHASQAYRAAPADGARRELAVRSGLAAHREEALAECLLAAAHAEGDATARLARLVEDAERLLEGGVAPALAAPLWREALALAPGHARALEALEQVAREDAAPDELAEVLRLKAEAAADAAGRRGALLERGALLAGLEGRAEEAAQAWEAVLEDTPDDAEAFGLLADLLREHGPPDALADLLERRIATASGAEEERALRLELGALAWRRLDQSARAVALFRELLAADPEDAEALASLEAMWGEGLEREPIFRVLEPLYEGARDWERLAALYTSTLELEEQPDLVLECLRKVARVQLEHLGDPAAAFASTKALVERADEPEHHLEDLEALAATLDAWEDVADFYEGLVADGRAAPALALRLGRLAHERLGEPERALRYVRLAVERAPDDQDARDALTEVLEAQERWEELADHLVTSAAADLDPRRACERLQAAADVLARRLRRPRDAAHALQRALELPPAPERLHDDIEALLIEAGDRPGLHAHYRAWLAGQAPPQGRPIRLRLVRSLLARAETAAEGIGELAGMMAAGLPEAQAVEVLEAFLADPSHAGPPWADPIEAAATMLVSSLGASADAGRRARIELARLRVLPPGPDQTARRLHVAGLLEEIDDADGAFAQYAQVLRAGASPPDVEVRLEQLAERHGLWTRLAALLAEALDRGVDEEVRPRWLLRLANIHADRLGDADAAAPWFERLLEAEPGNADAIEALAAYYQATERPADEARVLAAWLEQGPDGEGLGARRRRLARLRMDALDDPAGALALLELERPDASRDAELRRRLERLYGAEGRFADLVAVWDEALEATDLGRDDRVELLAKKAQIAETRLQDLAVARSAALAILAIDPDHGFALTSAQRIEAKRGDWAAVNGHLSRRIQVAADDEARVPLLLARAEIALDHLDQPIQALGHLEMADLKAGPGPGPDELVALYERLLRDPQTRRPAAERLAHRYEAREDWRGLATVLAMLAATAELAEERERLALQLAEVTTERVGDPAAALRTLLGTFRASPGLARVRARVEELASALGSWDPVAAAGEEALGRATEPDQVRDLGLWLGRIHLAERGAAAEARAAYERVLAVDELNEAAMQALDGIYQELGDWDALRRLLDTRLATVADEDRPAILVEMAALAERQGGPAAALPWWRDLLWEQPGHPEARARLEEMAGDPATAAEAAELLEPLYAKEEAWEPLAGVLERQLAVTGDPEARLRVHARLASLYDEKLGRGAAAFRHFAAQLEMRPDDLEIVARLERIAAREGRWGDLADALDVLVDRVEGPKRRLEVLLHAAQVREIKTHEPERAVAALERVRAVDPDHRAALMGLRRLHKAAGRKAEQLVVTRRLAEQEADPARALELWREVAELARAASDATTEIAAQRALLAAEPESLDVADRLAALYEQVGRFDALVELLGERAERTADEAEAARLRRRIGELRETKLDDVDGALEEYAEALERDPTNEEAFRAMERHFRDRELWGDLFGLLARRAEELGRRPAAVSTWIELAELAERQLGDRGEAIRAYERALEIDPTCARALDTLIGIRSRQTGAERELARLHEVKARAAVSAKERRRLLSRAAEILAVAVRDPAAAEPLLAEVLEEDPQHAGAGRILARVRMAEGRYDLAASLLEGLVERLPDDERVETLVSLGRLYRDHLGRPDEARDAFIAARKIAPDHPAVAAALRDVLAASGEWKQLEPVLVREYEAAVNAHQKSDRALELARLHLEELDDEEGFLTWIGRAQDARRDSPEVAEALIAFHTARERWDEVAPRLEWLVSYLDGKKLVAELPTRAHELARLLEKLGEKPKALEYYKLAMQTDGTYLANLLDYGRLLVELGQWDRALRVHQTLLMQRDRLESPAEKASVLYHLALASAELGQKPQARVHLGRLLAEAPGHPDGLALKQRLG